MPGGRYQGHGAAVINGKLYVPGGWTISPPLPNSSLFIYDLATNTWTSGASMPILSACGASGVINDKLYVTTACDGFSGYRSFLHVYDPVANSWTALPSSPNAHGVPAFGVIGGKLYVVGGNDAAGVIRGTLDVYDPLSNTWTTKAPMPTARTAAASAVGGGKLGVIGGSNGTINLSTVEVYDPATDTWTTAPAMPTARNGAAAAVVGDTVYVAGGAGATTLATVESISPTAGVTWSTNNAAIATIAARGLASGVAPGTVTITATSGAVAGSTTLTVAATPDTTSPNAPTISSGPSGTVTSTSASFIFSATDPTSGGVSSGVASYECKLDAGGLSTCTSPKSYASLAEGSHTFEARAVDVAGNTGAAASQTWTIDTTNPNAPTISSGPSGTVTSTTATFAFSATDPTSGGVSSGVASFECQLDAGGFAACTSPKTYTVTAGSHTFQVRALDNAGNTGAATSRTWTVSAAATSTVLNFDSATPGSASLAGFGISITGVSGSGTPAVTIQAAPSWVAISSPPNALVGPGGAGATSYTLVLPSAVTSISFSRGGPTAPTSVAGWTATALNASVQTVASVGEPFFCCTRAAQTFTLSGIGITSLRVTSDGCSCGIQSPWIDDLTFTPAL